MENAHTLNNGDQLYLPTEEAFKKELNLENYVKKKIKIFICKKIRLMLKLQIQEEKLYEQ